MSNVIADLKKNTLYVVDQLKGIRLELKTEDGKFLTLDDFLRKAVTVINKEGSKLKGVKVPTGMVGTLLGLSYIPATGMYVTPPALQNFSNGFQLGSLFERLRTKRVVSVTTEEFDLSAAEMDAILGSNNSEDEDAPDAEG